MNFENGLRRLALAGLLAACSSGAAAPLTIKLIAFNDLHGYLEASPVPLALDGGRTRVPAGGIAYLATAVHRLQARNPLSVVVGAGDMIGASPLISAHYHDEPTIQALDALGLEYTSVGNHEFDRGRAELLRMQNGGCAPVRDGSSCAGGRFEGAHFRYLAANVIDASSGKPLFPAYAIKDFPAGRQRVRVGFIGAVLRQTASMVTPAGVAGLRFTDEAVAANAAAAQLHRRGVNAIVLLIHQGVDTGGGYDQQPCVDPRGALLDILPRLDDSIRVVVSGHTHQAYVCRSAGTPGHPGRLYTSAGSYGRFVTDIDLQIDPAGDRILAAQAHNQVVASGAASGPDAQRYPALAPDPGLAAQVARDDARVAALSRRAVGRITADFRRASGASGESALGDLVADAQLAATRAADCGGGQIALTNPGGLRNDLRVPEGGGAVDFGAVFSAQPFGNTLVTLSLSGAQIRAVLEQQWHGGRAARMLQVSQGFSYRWRADAPGGAHVDPASLRLDGRPIEPARVYRVTVNSYLASGGDGFSVLAQAQPRTDSGLNDAQALADYLAAHSPLSPSRQPRFLPE